MGLHTNKVSAKHGFTLVELMVAVTLVVILISMARTTFKRFKFIAARAEVKLNINGIESLMASAVSDDPSNPYVGQYGLLGFIDSDIHNAANQNSAFRDDNPIGFRVANPSKLRYFYSFDQGRINAVRGKAIAEFYRGANRPRAESHSFSGSSSGLNFDSCYRESRTNVNGYSAPDVPLRYTSYADSFEVYRITLSSTSTTHQYAAGQIVQTSDFLAYCNF